MPIIGKLLKRTNAITYRRNLKKRKDLANQLVSLEKILVKARKTTFGKRHQFDTILESENRVHTFQELIPLTDYDRFYQDWLKDTMSGQKDHTWPGRIKYYALSSGTTGSPSKRIPVTSSMIRFFQKTSINQLAILHELDLPDTFYEGQFLVVGGSSKLVKKEHHVEGDLSGILKKHTSLLVSPLTRPGKKITAIRDWNQKLERMVEKAPEWNISIIAGVPSWCILLMERIIERYKVKHIHEIWPNLEVYVHGGVFMDPYRKRLERVLGRKIYLMDTYLASEGYFGYQKHPDRKGMQLLLEAGVFFEFIPFNSDYFDENGELLDRYAAFTIDEVQPDVDYALVITTHAGLWRYLIGDLVRFTDIEQREVLITGRIKQFLSLCGEHLSLDNINQAVYDVSQSSGFEAVEFTLCANPEELQHHWFIGSDDLQDGKELVLKIDDRLKELNDDYRCARAINLKEPLVTVVPTKRFYAFMESLGKSGSQHKVPRVMNAVQKKRWQKFLESATE